MNAKTRVASSVAVVAMALAVPVSTAQQKPSEAYSSAVASYVAGDFDKASDVLASLPHRDIEEQVTASVQAIRTNSGSEGARKRLEAMAVLHTEFALFADLEPDAARFHVDMAHLALTIDRKEALTPAARPRAETFLPRWCAVASSVLLLHALEQQASACVEETLKLFPEDREMLFWRGVVLEFSAVWRGQPVIDPHSTNPSMARANPAGYDMLSNSRIWVPVEDAYRHLLALEPDQHEARLHLGYALYSLRRYTDAKVELDAARDHARDPFVAYMASLFKARLEEEQRDLDGAARDYEGAMAIMPGAQNAYMGLSLLEARRGNATRARDLVAKFAAIPERSRVRDPWWEYHGGRVPIQDLEWLRKAVRQ